MQPVLIFVASALGFAATFWTVRGILRSILGTQTLNPLGVILISTGVVLFLARAIWVAIPLVIFGLILLSKKQRGAVGGPTSQTSTVRSKHLEMTLDHDSGTVDGRILAGQREGQLLSKLALHELLEYHVEIEMDDESIKLFQTFLDNAHPDWRNQHDENSTRGEEQPPLSKELSQDQAYEVLGLKAGCSEEDIRKAYHRLIKRVHPDSGGSSALMAQVTQARDKLLGTHT
jgi:hypothetical protein